MKTNFKMSVGEIIKETIIAFITYMALSVLACAVAWPILKWNDKRQRRKAKEKEETPSPESFYDVERAEDVHFTDEVDDDHPVDQEEAE